MSSSKLDAVHYSASKKGETAMTVRHVVFLANRSALSYLVLRYLPGSFHLTFFVIFGNEVTKISCHFQAKTVQLKMG